MAISDKSNFDRFTIKSVMRFIANVHLQLKKHQVKQQLAVYFSFIQFLYVQEQKYVYSFAQTNRSISLK